MENRFLATGRKSEPIRGRVEELRKATPEEITEQSFQELLHGVKHEMYALTTYLLEPYHLRTRNTLQDYPEAALDDLRSSIHVSGELAKALTLIEGHVTWNNEESHALSDTDLEEALTSEYIFPRMYRQAFEKSLVAERAVFDPHTQAVYRRLGDLLYKSQARLVVSGQPPRARAQCVEQFIKAGVVTAATESWSILVSIIKGYNAQFHQALSPEVLDTLTGDIKKILNQTASLHIADFDVLRDLSKEEGKPDLRQIAWDTILELSGTPPQVHVSLKEAFRNFSDAGGGDRRECTQGCPGRDAIVTNADGKKVNIIGDVFDFHKELAKRIVLPHQSVLLK